MEAAGGAVAVGGPATAAAAAAAAAAPPTPASLLAPTPAPPPPPPLAPLQPTITLTILPRTQTETWSAYWKESMRTVTRPGGAFELAAAPGDTLGGVLAEVGRRCGWPDVGGLER